MKVCPRCSELYPDDATRCPRDGAEVRPVLDPLIGRTVGGRYRLISRLGAGGMSSVYLARHVMIDRLMAIKTLRRDLAQDPVQRDRFLREARAVNRINHENIVEITDFGESDDGMVYLVMEYVPGDPLLKIMAPGPMSSHRALHIAEQVANALSRAHQMGVIHRDLKPENILVLQRKDDPDFVKILDFGIAKIMDAPSLTGSQQIFGTPGYIAPEYIQSTHIDGRADLYSLGVILYEMVCAALPFDYEYPGDLLVKHVTEQPIPPSARHRGVEKPIEELVMRCLRKKPDERFRDAFHFLSELQKVRERLGPATSWGALSQVPPPASAIQVQTPEYEPMRDTIVDPLAMKAALDARPAPVPTLDEPIAPPDIVASPEPLAEKAPQETPVGWGAKPAKKKIARMPTMEYSRPDIPNAPSLDGVDVPIEIEVREAVEEARAPSTRPPTPLRLATDGLLGVRRWRARFDALRAALDVIEESQPAPAEIAQAMARVATQLDRLEEGVTEAETHQKRALELSDEARAFRGTLGRSIDEVGRKLSERRGELERLASRRTDLRGERDVTKKRARTDDTQTGRDDAVMWELARVEEELRTEGTRCDELEAQLAELRAELDKHNEQNERELGKLVQTMDREMLDLEPLAAGLRAPLERVAEFIERSWG